MISAGQDYGKETQNPVRPPESRSIGGDLYFVLWHSPDLSIKVSWSHRFADRVTVEPALGIYNLFNFSNYNIPPSDMNAWVDAGGAGSSTTQPGEIGPESLVYRTGLGTGVFGLGSPRVMEFGLHLTF